MNESEGLLAEWLSFAPSWLRGVIEWMWEEHKRELIAAVWAGVWGVTRLAGKTVQSGQLGVKFSFGRAVRVCEPGFYPLIPIFQTVRVIASRARTLDLPLQRLTTRAGLVYEVDANVVYRVADPLKAFVQIDSLEKGMLQALGLSVWEVLSNVDAADLKVSQELDEQLAARMGARLEPWGVTVDRAGFSTLHPSRETVRITQLRRLASKRAGALAWFAGHGLGGESIGLLGASGRYVSRTRSLRNREVRSRRKRYEPGFVARMQKFVAEHPKLGRKAAREDAIALVHERYARLLAR